MREFIVKEYQTFPYKGAVHEMPELIRCKDCKHYAGGTACFKTDAMFTASEDGYCSWVERKEE